MRGDGIKLDNTRHNPPPARLIDVTRLLRRAGRAWTGVDRVELAYLERLLAEETPLWGLARTPYGYVLLDRAGLAKFDDRVSGRLPFGRRDLLSRLTRGAGPVAQAAQSDARRFAIARTLRRGLPGLLQRHLPRGTVYLNLGHSNLTNRVLRAVRGVPESRITVFIHDMIPLTHPQFQRAGTTVPFEAKMRRVRAYADRILYNSADTRRRAEAVMAAWGSVPEGVVAHLGTNPPHPDPRGLPEGLPPDAPYFVTLGTIEPRKNHALLLDVWDALGQDAPPLIILGARGWNNDAVFARLDALDPDGPVREVSGLDDGAVAALIEGAQALLFPSHAEGFGLPAIEALALGTPVICSNIATFREILGDRAVYLNADDWQIWERRVVEWSQRSRDAVRVRDFDAPRWDAHFKVALSFT